MPTPGFGGIELGTGSQPVSEGIHSTSLPEAILYICLAGDRMGFGVCWIEGLLLLLLLLVLFVVGYVRTNMF